MRTIVILSALLLFGFLTSCKDKKEKVEMTEQKVEVLEVAAPEPEPVIQPREEPKPVEKQMNYYLVAGCFKVYDNAVRLNAKLLDQGYDSRIVPFYNMNMVTYDGYETRQDAQYALNRIVKEPGKELTWVYPVK